MRQFMALIMLLMVVFVSTLSVNAQDNTIDCNNIDPIVDGLVSILQNSVESPTDLVALVAATREIFVECDVVEAQFLFSPLVVSSDNNPEPGLSRSNPLPILEWFKFAGGQVRVVSVENYDLGDYGSYSIPEGMRVIAVNMEYSCEKANENESCQGLEIGLVASYISDGGVVLNSAPIYNDENISMASDGHEVYSGAVITGRIYFTIDAEETPNIMRLDSQFNPNFFAVNPLTQDNTTNSVPSTSVPPPPSPLPSSTAMVVSSSTPQPPTNTPQPTATLTPSRPMAIILSGANLRSGPSTAFNPPVDSIAANQEAEIVAVNPARDWYKIEYFNRESWILASLVQTTGDVSLLPVDLGPPTPIPPTPVPPTPIPPPTAIPNPVNLYVVNIQIDPHPLKCQKAGEIQVTVGNNGTSNAESGGKILIEAVLVSSGAVLESTVTIFGPIAAGSQETASASLTVGTNYDELQRIRVSVDVDGQVSENNEGDNVTAAGTDYILKKGNC